MFQERAGVTNNQDLFRSFLASNLARAAAEIISERLELEDQRMQQDHIVDPLGLGLDNDFQIPAGVLSKAESWQDEDHKPAPRRSRSKGQRQRTSDD